MMADFAHGVLTGVGITATLSVFILIWIYLAECRPPSTKKKIERPKKDETP